MLQYQIVLQGLMQKVKYLELFYKWPQQLTVTINVTVSFR